MAVVRPTATFDDVGQRVSQQGLEELFGVLVVEGGSPAGFLGKQTAVFTELCGHLKGDGTYDAPSVAPVGLVVLAEMHCHHACASSMCQPRRYGGLAPARLGCNPEHFVLRPIGAPAFNLACRFGFGFGFAA